MLLKLKSELLELKREANCFRDWDGTGDSTSKLNPHLSL